MKHLTQYVEQLNFANRLFKQPELDVNRLTQDQVTEICAKLNSALCQENLTCDGELTPAQVRRRLTFLNGVIKDLSSTKFQVSLDEY